MESNKRMETRIDPTGTMQSNFKHAIEMVEKH